jgi:hypothetical protein
MNKDIFLKLAIYFGMDKSTNFGIRYSIILQKKGILEVRSKCNKEHDSDMHVQKS